MNAAEKADVGAAFEAEALVGAIVSMKAFFRWSKNDTLDENIG